MSNNFNPDNFSKINNNNNSKKIKKTFKKK